MSSVVRRIPIALDRFSRALIIAALLFVVAVPAVAGRIAPRLDESTSPFEVEEEAEEKVEECLAGSQRRFRLASRGQRRVKLTPRPAEVRRLSLPATSLFVRGHRLPNGVLAPLTS